MNSENLYEKLGAVLEPDILVPIAELGMISELSRRLSKYSVNLYAYPAPRGYFDGLVSKLEQVASQEGAKLEVSVKDMTDEQLSSLESRLMDLTLADSSPGGERINRLMAPGTKTRILGFSSGKGGVGKSSVTVGIATALARRGHRVGILDADVYGF